MQQRRPGRLGQRGRTHQHRQDQHRAQARPERPDPPRDRHPAVAEIGADPAEARQHQQRQRRQQVDHQQRPAAEDQPPSAVTDNPGTDRENQHHRRRKVENRNPRVPFLKSLRRRFHPLRDDSQSRARFARIVGIEVDPHAQAGGPFRRPRFGPGGLHDAPGRAGEDADVARGQVLIDAALVHQAVGRPPQENDERHVEARGHVRLVHEFACDGPHIVGPRRDEGVETRHDREKHEINQRLLRAVACDEPVQRHHAKYQEQREGANIHVAHFGVDVPDIQQKHHERQHHQENQQRNQSVDQPIGRRVSLPAFRRTLGQGPLERREIRGERRFRPLPLRDRRRHQRREIGRLGLLRRSGRPVRFWPVRFHGDPAPSRCAIRQSRPPPAPPTPPRIHGSCR